MSTQEQLEEIRSMHQIVTSIVEDIIDPSQYVHVTKYETFHPHFFYKIQRHMWTSEKFIFTLKNLHNLLVVTPSMNLISNQESIYTITILTYQMEFYIIHPNTYHSYIPIVIPTSSSQIDLSHESIYEASSPERDNL